MVAWLVGGCTPRPRAAPVAPTLDPAAVFGAVRAREEQIATLRARFTADSRSGEERHSTSGVLLVKKPDRFRLRMMLPFGVTVFDYLRTGEHVQVSLPLQDRVLYDPPPDDSSAFSQADLGTAFLRGPDAFPGDCTPESAGTSSVAIVCRARSGTVLRRIVTDAPSATIRDETTYEADAPHLVIGYDDYRPVQATSLPFHITMQYPGRAMRVEIVIQRYEVNPGLSDDLFQATAR